MKLRVILMLVVSLMSFNAFAASSKIVSMSEKDAAIDVDRVVSATLLDQKPNKGITVRAVVLENGGSTDVSPSKHLFLTYFHKGEQTNVHTVFDLGSFYEVKKIKHSGTNIYNIQVVDMVPSGDGEKLSPVNLTIDSSQMFTDDQNLKLQEFDDRHFESSIKVTRKKVN